jgi:hypothetical protein
MRRRAGAWEILACLAAGASIFLGLACQSRKARCRHTSADASIPSPLWKYQLRFDYFAAAQAGRAHAHVLRGRSHFRVNRTQIDVPAPLAHVVGVADGVSKLRPLAAYITYSSHDFKILPGLLPKPLFYRRTAPPVIPSLLG